MAFQSNFHLVAQIAEEVDPDDGSRSSRVHIGGLTTDSPAGWSLVSRHLLLQQPARPAEDEVPTIAHGLCDLGERWSVVDPPIDGAGFEAGDALATGTESYLRRTSPGAAARIAQPQPPSLVTITWSQVIEIAVP